ncbi:MAG: alpha/beta fold hydrolase [Desulfuromonadaceae bacterium]|nr:alpha/beta fold hydrolase [Desulfuromonadaceae bacterium]
MKVLDAVAVMRAEAMQAGVDNVANRPFLLTPEEPTERAVLLVHGFTASPWEMLPVAEYLQTVGFASLAVRLAGHGTCPEDLATRRWQEWRNDVAVGYRLLAENYRQVFAVGVSTGALLLLHRSLTDRYVGLTLISPYLRLRHQLAPWADWLHRFIPYQRVNHASTAAPYYYPRRPLAGVAQLNRLVAQIKTELPKMKTPTLILGGGGDRTIDVGSTRTLFNRLGAPDKTCYQFGQEATHVLCAPESPVQGETLRRIAEFFNRQEADK